MQNAKPNLVSLVLFQLFFSSAAPFGVPANNNINTTEYDFANGTDSTTHNPNTTSAATAFPHADFPWNYQATLYLVIGGVGIVGNGMTIIVLSSSKTLRNKLVNMFLINQSAIDFFASIFLMAAPHLPYGTTGHFGVRGQLFCRLWNPRVPLWSLLSSSTASLVTINIERYLGVVHPLFHKTSITKTHAVVAMIACWISGPMYNVPAVVFTSKALPNGLCATMKFWPSSGVSKFYGILAICLQFFIPVGVMAFVYTRMLFVLKNKAKVQPVTVAHNQTGSSNQNSKIKKNIIKTMASVSLCFVICWSWNEIFFFVSNLGYPVTYGVFYDFTVYMAFLNSCLNPLIYAKQYKDFKTQAKRLFGKLLGHKFDESSSDGSSFSGTSTN